MKPATLARLRAIVQERPTDPADGPKRGDGGPAGGGGPEPASPLAADGEGETPPRAAAAILTATARVQSAALALGGKVVETEDGPSVLVERRYAPGHRVGTIPLGACATALHGASPSALGVLGSRGADSHDGKGPLVFLDIETTGLAGGAGTVAFLIGCAWFEGEALRVRQIVMPEHRHERAALAALRTQLAPGPALVTYNGRTFDVPVLEVRFSFHRQHSPFDDRQHLDMLPAARRLWRGARPVVALPGAQAESCSLSVLERTLFGARRLGDVPGFEIPGRYFTFLRTGDGLPLRPVLEHNRLDLVSLAAVTARAVSLLEAAPDGARPRECLGLARLLDRAGLPERARACYERVAVLTEGSWHADEDWIRADALRALAVCARRAGRHDEAAGRWQAITRLRGCPPRLLREAYEALAIHCEHRARDVIAARGYAERSGQLMSSAGYRALLERRLARLDRKQHGAPAPPGEPPFWT